MKKIRVGIVYGGYSAEREVSLVTGQAIFNNLNRKRYDVALVELSRERDFLLVTKNKRVRFDFYTKAKKMFDIIFLALHGTGGEDGVIQGMLEMLGVPYTGSGVAASALAMNKVHAAAIYGAFDIPTPDFIHFTKAGFKEQGRGLIERIRTDIGYPAVVKPVDQGSAVGVSVVKDESELLIALKKTFKDFPWLMVQKFVKGSETTCGVLEKKGVAFALPPTRIVPHFGKFYDYNSKYAAGGSSHVCPADFPLTVNSQLQTLALKAHQALDCRGMSRTDIFVTDDKKFFVLETNTVPGMTPTSLLPEAAQKAGISFPAMLDLIVACSL